MKRYIKADIIDFEDESDYLTRFEIARSCSRLSTIEKFSQDPDPFIRIAVAKNPNTPPEIVYRLAHDDQWEVRARVAERADVSTDILNELSQDPIHCVRLYVAENPITPKSVLLRTHLSGNYATELRERIRKMP